MKRFVPLLFVVVLIALAPAASACEICKKTSPGGPMTCWSGMPAGWDWCFGGFGEPCTGDGECDQGTGFTSPSDEVCPEAVLGCTPVAESAPTGFVLDQTAEPVASE